MHGGFRIPIYSSVVLIHYEYSFCISFILYGGLHDFCGSLPLCLASSSFLFFIFFFPSIFVSGFGNSFPLVFSFCFSLAFPVVSWWVFFLVWGLAGYFPKISRDSGYFSA